MKGMMIFQVEGKKLNFEDYEIKLHSGGPHEEQVIRLKYYDATGQTCSFGDVLFTQGTLGSGDFFQILAEMDATLNGTGLLSVRLNIQYDMPPGTSQAFTLKILNSIPFVINVIFS